MAGYIFIDREDDMGGMRTEMHRRYRGGNYRNYGGSSSNMREHYYKKGYEHAMEDMEDEEMEMRRRRDSLGRYM